jgi:hypothetical protein
MQIQDSVPCEVIYLLKLVIIISSTAKPYKISLTKRRTRRGINQRGRK